MCRWPVLVLVLLANPLFADDTAPKKDNPIPYKSTFHEVYQGGKFVSRAASAEEAQKVAVNWEKLTKKKGTTIKGPFYQFSQSASELTKLIYELTKNPDFAWLRDWLAPLMDPFIVPEGQITFDSEGTEGGRYHTRKPHVPPVGQSGITIGRGYDIGQRMDKEKIKQELMAVGLSEEEAEAYAGAAGLKRDDADEYLNKNKDKLVELTPEQQNKLFQITYVRYRDGSPGIKGAKAILKDRYGVTDWDKLDPTMREILVDMNYRGDLNRDGTTDQLKEAVKNNDLTKFYNAMADKDFWFPDHKISQDKYGKGRYNLDPNRFNKRVQLLKKALGIK